MTPSVFQIKSNGASRKGGASSTAGEPDMSYLPLYNDIGGRPDERYGTRGSFTPGIRVVSGGPARDVPLQPEVAPGMVLNTYPELKPDMSGEARTNAVRPTERFGTRGSFTPGDTHAWLGGTPRDVPLEAGINPGIVLQTYPHLQPDMSSEARTNAIRPTERWGSRGSFTPGVRIMSGGPASDMPLEAEVDHGTVLFTSSKLKPNCSWEARTNIGGGRPDERLGSRGSFTPGSRCWQGGTPREIPLETEIDPGTVLFTYPELKPDLSGEARTNAVRPAERFGSHGSFTPGERRRWLGGQPRNVPRERELDHGTVLFKVAHDTNLHQERALKIDDQDEFFFHSDCVEEEEEEVKGEPHQMEDISEEDATLFRGRDKPETGVAGGGDNGVFRRCGSDSKFPAAGADLGSGNFPAF